MNARLEHKGVLVPAGIVMTVLLATALVIRPRQAVEGCAALATLALAALLVRARHRLARMQLRRLLGWTALLLSPAALIGPVLAFPRLPQLFAFRALLLLLIALGVVLSMAGGHVAWRLPRVSLPLTLWFVWLSVTLLWATDKTAGLRYVGIVAGMLLLTLATAHAGSNARRLHFLATALAAVFGLTLLVSLLESVTGLRLPSSVLATGATGSRATAVTSFYYNENDLATFLAMAWPFLLAVFLFTTRGRWQALALAGMALALFAFLHTGSRSGLIVIALETLVLTPVILRLSSLRAVRLTLVFGVLIAAGLAWLAFNTSENALLRQLQVSTLLQNVEQGYGSGDTRLGLTRAGGKLALESRLLGVGAGNAEGAVKRLRGDPNALGNLHDWWMEVLVNGGLPALALFALFYGRLLAAMYRIARGVHETLVRYLATGTAVALLGFLIGALGPSTAVSFAPMWVLFGLALALIVRANALHTQTRPIRPEADRDGAPAAWSKASSDGAAASAVEGRA